MASSTPSVFQKFLNRNDLVQGLRNALDTLCFTNVCALMSLTITQSNGASKYGSGGFPFAKAYVDVKDNTETGDTIYHFGTIFEQSASQLESFLSTSSMPCDRKTATLFSLLFEYLLGKEQQNILKEEVRKKDLECEVAALLARHFFSKLSVSPYFTLDKHYPHSNTVQVCPCGCEDDIFSHYGDTSIGNQSVWHGNIDILLDGISVQVADEQEEEYDCEKSSEEVSNVSTKKSLNNPDLAPQIISQTIVTSFLQTKNHPEFGSLIPSIAVNKTHIMFYFYDSEKDVLLKSPSFSFLNNNHHINMVTILATWFVVNYKSMCTGIQDKYFQDVKKANFFDVASTMLPVYKNELRLGGDIQSNKLVLRYQPAFLSMCTFIGIDRPEDEPPKKKLKEVET